MQRKVTFMSVALILIIVGYILITKHYKVPTSIEGVTNMPKLQPVDIASTPLGQRTKTSGCVITSALPDTSCTPGAVISSATKDQICVSGYSKSVRNVPNTEKDQVYAEYNITSHTTGQYEVDHLVSLELGGSNDISNLWPEPADPTPGFHQKDGVENTLHAEVCNGTLTLLQAQQEIAGNWLAVYQASH